MHITRARPDDAATLTEIAFAAKRHWGYPMSWIESWRDVLTVRPEFIAGHETYAAIDEGRAIGFYALGRKGERRAASSPPSSPREERVGRGPRRGETNKNAPPLPSPLLHPVEEREKSRSLMQPWGERMDLLHLWVLPEAMGRGVGRSLFSHALERARILGFRELEIESDPNAEGFYQRMGAHRVGTSTKVLAGHNRELPVLVYELDHVASAKLGAA